MTAISPKHGAWADLMKEVFNQLKENENDIDKIIDRLKKPKRGDEPFSNFYNNGFCLQSYPSTFLYFSPSTLELRKVEV